MQNIWLTGSCWVRFFATQLDLAPQKTTRFNHGSRQESLPQLIQTPLTIFLWFTHQNLFINHPKICFQINNQNSILTYPPLPCLPSLLSSSQNPLRPSSSLSLIDHPTNFLAPIRSILALNAELHCPVLLRSWAVRWTMAAINLLVGPFWVLLQVRLQWRRSWLVILRLSLSLLLSLFLSLVLLRCVIHWCCFNSIFNSLSIGYKHSPNGSSRLGWKGRCSLYELVQVARLFLLLKTAGVLFQLFEYCDSWIGKTCSHRILLFMGQMLTWLLDDQSPKHDGWWGIFKFCFEFYLGYYLSLRLYFYAPLIIHLLCNI